MDIKIRPLTNADFFTAVDMLSKLGGVAGRELSGLISSQKTVKPADAQSEEVGLQIAMIIFETCYKHVRDDLIAWFASLCGKTPAEFMEMPPETTIQIMEQLTEAEESQAFFTRALGLFKKTPMSKNQSTKKSS